MRALIFGLLISIGFQAAAQSATYFQAEITAYDPVSCNAGYSLTVVRYITLDAKNSEAARDHFKRNFRPQVGAGRAAAPVSCAQHQQSSDGFISELEQVDGAQSTRIRAAKLVKRVDPDVRSLTGDWTSEDLGVECSN